MKARIAELVAALRRAEVPVSVAEAMDAAEAAAWAGVERRVLCDALGAALVKDERDRPLFLAAFAAVFPAGPAAVLRAAKKGRRRRHSGEPGAAGHGGATADGGEGAPGAAATAGSNAPPKALQRSGEAARPNAPPHRREREDRRGDPAHDGESGVERDVDARLARREHALARLPFRAMTAADVEEAAALARAIARRVTARFRRRLAPRVIGRLDFRRTIRAAVPRGGVPFERRYRGRRPGRPDLVALADLSASAATASAFFLSLLAPAAPYFRRVHLFGYVDRLVEIEFEGGQVRPAGPIDLMARSDFGRVLRDLSEEGDPALGGDAVLLILGDARNNRRPPRADLLAAVRNRVRRVLWLNPDPCERWNTGDSVIATYTRHADAVVPCGSLVDLERALAVVARW